MVGIPKELQEEFDAKNAEMAEREEAYWKHKKGLTIRTTIFGACLALLANLLLAFWGGSIFLLFMVVFGAIFGALIGKFEVSVLPSLPLFALGQLVAVSLVLLFGVATLNDFIGGYQTVVSLFTAAGWGVVGGLLGLYMDGKTRIHI